MKGKIGDRQRMLHIIESITEIEKYISGSNFEQFAGNSMMRFACIKQLEIIGEAANNISIELKDKNTDVQWTQIVGLRHILVHEYFGIDNNLIWQIISSDIPKLKEQIQMILSY